MSLTVKIQTDPSFMGITGSTHYDFLDSNEQIIKAKFVAMSRIDGFPIFNFRKLDLKRSNTKPTDLKLEGYNIQYVELITPMENFSPGFSGNPNPNFVENINRAKNDIEKLEELANTLGYDIDDIRDDNKYKAIIRNLKLKQII